MLASKLASVPIRMHTVSGMPLLEAKGMKRTILDLVEKLTYWSATNVYPNSVGLKEIIIQNKLTKPKKLKVIANGSSNGINTKHFSPENFSATDQQKLKNKLNISEQDFVFVFVGRLVGDKGINELVEAFIKLNKQTRNTKLLLVGNEEPELDPLLPQIQQEIQNNPNIITTGWVEDVRPYLAVSDVFVFPSYREGMPNVVLQAGAMGLPQIVTDINGSNEIIIDKENGLIIPVKDTKALLDAMQNIYTDNDLRNTLAKNARELILSRFEQQLVWDALLAEYKRSLRYKFHS